LALALAVMTLLKISDLTLSFVEVLMNAHSFIALAILLNAPLLMFQPLLAKFALLMAREALAMLTYNAFNLLSLLLPPLLLS